MSISVPKGPLSAALNPGSVAVLGATEDRNKVGGRPIYYMNRFGYRGSIFPINPSRAEVQGFTCHPDLGALDQAPDLAIVAVSADRTEGAVRACVDRGVRAAIIMSSGFGETGESGRQRESDLVRIASRSGMRLIGPNAQGIANFYAGAVANFSTIFMEVPPADGPVAIISQSGAASAMPYALLRERGIGVRYLMATGNDADVTVADFVDEVLEDPAIRVILLYLEAIRDAEVLAAAAAKARAKGVAIIALKSGTSAKGIAAASSHTGALATEDAVVTAFFRRHGIWRVRDIDELVSAVPLYLQGRAVGAGRTLVMSHSGAVGVVCADAAERLGLPMPDLSPQTCARLRDILPAFGAAQNPLDLTAGLLSDSSMFGNALAALAADDNIDVMHIGMPVAGEGYDIDGFAKAAGAVGSQVGKPVVVSGPQRNVLEVFTRWKLPTYQSDTGALRAIRQYVGHSHSLAARPAPSGRAFDSSLLGGSVGPILSEADSLRLLESTGISIVRHRLCRSLAEAVATFREFGGPCVVKASSADIPHKTELGLVWLNLRDEAAVESAYGTCLERMQALGAEGSVIVAQMRTGLREMVVGARRDPTFGPVVLVGDGGKYIEVLKDYELLVPPFALEEARAALERLRIWPILQGARGEPAADVEAICRATVALGDLIVALPRIESIDVNPVLVNPVGEGAVALDALISLHPGATAPLNSTEDARHAQRAVT